MLAFAIAAFFAIVAAPALAIPPVVAISPTVTPGYNTAVVSGTISTLDSISMDWGFEYTTDPAVEGWQGTAYEGLLPSGEPTTPVSTELHNLKPGHQYQVRLVATQTSIFEPWYSPEPNPTFTTMAVTDPDLSVGSASEVGYSTAHVQAAINPHESPIAINYHFEYSADPAGEGWIPAGFGELSVAEAAANAPITVQADLEGLKTGTAYQFRLVASNGSQFISPEPDPGFTTEVVALPAVSLNPITTFSDSTADFFGSVITNAPAGPLSPADEAAFKAEWHFECEPECPGLSGGSIEADEASQAVSASATGLEPNTPYVVRLVASNAGGPTSGAQTFSTEAIPATVKAGAGASDGKGGYILDGVVNPHNSTISSCNFDYGPTSAYGQTMPCESSPGAVNRPVLVTAHPTGLTVGDTYHFRISVVTGAGPVNSGDGVFVPTLIPGEGACPNEALRLENHSLALPECRAYELATPGPMGGFSSVIFPATFTEDGALAYTTYNGNVANSGSGGQGSRFVSNRSETGWAPTENLNGSARSVLAGPDALFGPGAGPYYMSADLRSSLWFMMRPSQSGNTEDPYLRKPDGTFAPLGPYTSPDTPDGPPGHQLSLAPNTHGAYMGASADLSHVLFHGTPNSIYPAGLFEYVGTDNAAARRVDVDNSGNPISACGAGLSEGLNNVISIEGKTIFFQTLPCEGSPNKEELWARVGGATSYLASETHCTRTSSEPGGVCNAPANAKYEGAATDGSRVYLTTTQQLVNGDTNEGKDLYAYDLPTASNPDPSPALSEVSGGGSEANLLGVVRVSDDGSTVYFVAEGVLAGNSDALGEPAASGNDNLYVWQRDANHPSGQTKFVGKLVPGDNALWGNEGAVGRMAQATADGQRLVISTASPLVVTDTDAANDVYLYDAVTNKTIRVSTDVSGVGGNEEGRPATFQWLTYPQPDPNHRQRIAISNDGEQIVFQTTEALSPADTNNALDSYLWSAGHLSLISDGHWPGGTASAQIGPVIDGSGKNIYLSTNEPLTPNDFDAVPDTYDLRVDGGFSFLEATPCSGEACQSAPSAQPTAPAPATDQANGGGNVIPQRCPQGKVARNGHCIKKQAKKHQKKSHKKTKKHRKNARTKSEGTDKNRGGAK